MVICDRHLMHTGEKQNPMRDCSTKADTDYVYFSMALTFVLSVVGKKGREWQLRFAN